MMNMKSRDQQGFTLIELVMIIVILGILAAVAIPRFIDLSGNAQTAAVQGVASSLASASASNYSDCNALGHVPTANKCITVMKCSDISSVITPPLVLGAAGAPMANTYNLAADTVVAANGTEATCTLQYLKSGMPYIASYTITGAGINK